MKNEIITIFTLDKKRKNSQTCGRRMLGYGRQPGTENVDHWQKRGPNKCCSFCGSISPDDLEMIIDKVIERVEGYEISSTTKGYKFYVKQPKIENAGEGGIKYFTQHTPDDEEWINRVQPKLTKALKISREIFKLHMSKLGMDFPS